MASVVKGVTITPAAPTATVGGSTALWAALTPQAGTDALTLTAASVTAGATLQWTVYGPTDTDETAQIITAGDTTATPAWAAFSAASGPVGGGWKIRLDVTLGGLTTTYTRTVRVGSAAGWVTLADIDMAAIGAADWSTGSHTLGGATIAFERPGAVSTLGPDGSTGVRVVTSGAADWTASVRGGVTMSVTLNDYATLSKYKQLAIMLAAAPQAGFLANLNYWGLALELAAQPASLTALRHRPQYDGAHKAQSQDIRAGTAASVTASPGVAVRGCLMLLNWNHKTASSWYATAARTAAPDMADLATDGWTQIDGDATLGHLYAMRASYVLATLRATLFAGGSAVGGNDVTLTRFSLLGLS